MDDISSQGPLFSKEPSTLGFDLSSGNVWIYPENYPIREYQFNIVKNALYRNTLVCLPTGLGKTFIAAVIMYNFWRWYPKGKVIFLAPTKPLVAQQINACHEIMGIPSEEIIELTGTTNQKQREIAWIHKRVIFATPQTFHKDLEKNIFPINLVKCIVIDEAHKALGKHSYCESIRLLSAQNNYFRVLALSATPGDKISKVHEVISNLHISNLELRDDMSADIAPYINERKLDIILVRLSDELARFKERYIAVMDPHVRLLVRLNVLRGDTGNISKGRIFHLTREFQSRPNKPGNYGQIMKTLNILLTMYHAYELMIRHGLRAFLHFYENHSDKFWMEHEINLQDLLEDIKSYLGPFPIIEPLPDGSVPDVPNDLIFGHNKFYKLKELLERHFKSFHGKNQDTRAIVFVEYRDIVNEVHVLLLQSRPLIRPQIFVGKAGQKQKQQVRALENFRSNQVNVLISTSVGEEGLDVGEVDLIVCFDISQSSPIRLVQRMGRTGRQRVGHIIALVTDGKEHQSLKATMSKKDTLNNKVLQSSGIVSALYQDSPRMVPNEFKPECRKIHIKIQPKAPQVKGARKRKEYEKKKKQNMESKTVEREIGAKSGGQSSMDRFFKAKSVEKNLELDPLFTSQTQQVIKPENVKLLLSDKENIDFLTLCAMRNSRTDFHILDSEIDTKYIPSYPSKGLEVLNNFTLPDLSILDRMASLQNIEIILQKIKSQNISIFTNHEDSFDSNNFEKGNKFSDTHFEISEVTIGKSFADLIYESSSSDGVDIFEDVENKSNKFNNSIKFDDLLNETTDESEIEEIGTLQNQDLGKEVSSNAKNLTSEEREKELNFSGLLNTSNSVILENKETLVIKETPSRQQKVSGDNSFISLKSNCSGITITQAIEEVGRINANKLINNNSLVKKQDNNKIQIIKGIPVSSKTVIENIVPSTSEIQKAETQKKHLQLKISDSYDDLFNIDIDKVPIANDSNILDSNEPQVSKTLNKLNQDEVLLIHDNQIMRENSNKSVSVTEKENSNLALSAINDDDWESDFEVLTSAVDRQKYFKNEERLKPVNKIKSFETNWILCTKTLNIIDKKNSVPAKKLSLFNVNEPSTAHNNAGDKISSFNNLNKSSTKEQDNDDNDFEVFQKPVIQTPGMFSSKRANNNAQSTSNNKFNGYSAPLNKESTLNSKVEKRKVKTEISFNSSLEQNSEVRKNRKKSRRNCEFLDNEADVSIDGGETSEGTSGEDEDLENFVSYTQDFHEDLDMRAHYLHSVKSPARRPGAFLIKKSTRIEENVYSQPISQLNDTYLYDSFCVKGDESKYDEETEDDLEITYLHLSKESMKRDKKRKRGNSPTFQIKERKRRKGRIRVHSGSSSEDETEKIRREIQEESVLLKTNES